MIDFFAAAMIVFAAAMPPFAAAFRLPAAACHAITLFDDVAMPRRFDTSPF